MSTYKELISKTEDEKLKDNLEVNVELAANDLEIGINLVKGQQIKLAGEVKKLENDQKIAFREMEKAYGYSPFNVQKIIDLRNEWLQSEIAVTNKQKEVKHAADTFTFLENLKKELFPNLKSKG